jgi:hypothetical protein
MATCLVCESAIADIEIIHHGKDPLFVSAATLQSFRSTLQTTHAQQYCLMQAVSPEVHTFISADLASNTRLACT